MQHSECSGTNVVLPHCAFAVRSAVLGGAVEVALVLQDVAGGKLAVGTAIEVVQYAERATRAQLVQCSAAVGAALFGNTKEVARRVAVQIPQERIGPVVGVIEARKNRLRAATGHLPDPAVTVSSALFAGAVQ